MNKFRITSTSNLLPGNDGWRPLAARYDLDFGEFGDWPQVLLSGQATGVLWLCFLEDLIAPTAFSGPGTDDADYFDGLLQPIMQALHKRLDKSAAPTIVAWSTWRPDSPVRAARDGDPWRKQGRCLEAAFNVLAAREAGLYLIALDDVFAIPGYASCFDSRNYYAARCRLSRAGIEATALACAAVLARIDAPAKKVLVLDCDNTLWGGIVGEVGMAGLVLGQDGMGQAFTDFQAVALSLKQRGILLAIASNNNDNEVREVFDNHPGMTLKAPDIAAWRVDWQEKTDSINSLADELGLGLDSFVFWDDNPLEREKMRHALPQVLTPEPPTDITLWPGILAAMDELAGFSTSAEDRRKTEQYRDRAIFVDEIETADSEGDFLKSIDLRPRVQAIDTVTRSRAQQLCAKTNQFNLRTRRHSDAELVGLVERAGEGAFLVNLEDKFGDHGLTGLVIALPTATADVAFLDTFMLSCRVLGRHLEAWMLKALVDALMDCGVGWLVAEYVPTERNTIAGTFLTDHGFVALSDLAAADRDKLQAATAEMPCGGQIYVASLSSLSIPHLDVFNP
ncbi:MAG: HAD-IIIC family phosphatase [Rhodospirillales bacterium]|nr:HAD-IIIC family phosphatase [Rhodospirillales bacterium]